MHKQKQNVKNKYDCFTNSGTVWKSLSPFLISAEKDYLPDISNEVLAG